MEIRLIFTSALPILFATPLYRERMSPFTVLYANAETRTARSALRIDLFLQSCYMYIGIYTSRRVLPIRRRSVARWISIYALLNITIKLASHYPKFYLLA